MVFVRRSPFPVSEQLLCCLAYLADQCLAPQTGKSYLSAIRSMQISLGLPDPRDQLSLPVLKRVQAGISRARLARGAAVRVRLPITAPMLCRIHGAVSRSSDPERVILWAIACTEFFGFFRLGELLVESAGRFNPTTDLAWGDVAADSATHPSMLKIHLKQSKCDQFGAGVDIVVGRTGCALCPVSALLSYISLRQDRPGAFFWNLEGQSPKRGLLAGSGLFWACWGFPNMSMRAIASTLGQRRRQPSPGSRTPPSRRSGGGCAAFLQYIRMPRDQLAAISVRLVGPVRTPVSSVAC